MQRRAIGSLTLGDDLISPAQHGIGQAPADTAYVALVLELGLELGDAVSAHGELVEQLIDRQRSIGCDATHADHSTN
jgi:hypothetical protein